MPISANVPPAFVTSGPTAGYALHFRPFKTPAAARICAAWQIAAIGFLALGYAIYRRYLVIEQTQKQTSKQLATISDQLAAIEKAVPQAAAATTTTTG